MRESIMKERYAVLGVVTALAGPLHAYAGEQAAMYSGSSSSGAVQQIEVPPALAQGRSSSSPEAILNRRRNWRRGWRAFGRAGRTVDRVVASVNYCRRLPANR